ncbi:MAG: Zeta toxin [Mucilaginibacter sp.]|nr:Zeta toxin [Mucilaginibacter sp.]
MPNLYIIAGCNGAGKTTASYTVLPEILGCQEFVNADNIAAGLSPFNPESVALEAGRIMLKRIYELLDLYIPICNKWLIMNNVGVVSEMVAHSLPELGEVIINGDIWKVILTQSNDSSN